MNHEKMLGHSYSLLIPLSFMSSRKFVITQKGRFYYTVEPEKVPRSDSHVHWLNQGFRYSKSYCAHMGGAATLIDDHATKLSVAEIVAALVMRSVERAKISSTACIP